MCCDAVIGMTQRARNRKGLIVAWKVLRHDMQPIFRYNLANPFRYKPGLNLPRGKAEIAQVPDQSIGQGALHVFRTRAGARESVENDRTRRLVRVTVRPKSVVGVCEETIACLGLFISKADWKKAGFEV